MNIAISGPMCSGKTTIANLICNLNTDYKIYSFGGKIKALAKELFDMSSKDRSLLINIANKMKEINKDVWINYLHKQCLKENNCIIDDLRFENELESLKNNPNNSWHFIVIQIPTEIRIKRIKELYPKNYEDHIKNMDDISEKGLIDFPKERTLYINYENEDNILETIIKFIS